MISPETGVEGGAGGDFFDVWKKPKIPAEPVSGITPFGVRRGGLTNIMTYPK